MRRLPNGPESSVTLGDDDVTVLDETDDMAVTHRAPARSPLAPTQPPAVNAPAAPAAFMVSNAPAKFDGTKTLKIQTRPDPLASTVVLAEHPIAMFNPSTLESPASPALPFRPGPAAIAQTPQALAPMPPRPGEFTGTVTLSVADLVQAEAQPALPFEGSNPQAPPAVIPNFAALQPAPPSPPARTIGESFVAGAFAAPTAPIAETAAVRPDAPPQIAPEAPRDAIVLLYLHRPSMQRIVRKPAWQRILDALEDEPIDPEADDPALSLDPSEIQEQTQAYAILKQGRCIDRDAALATLETAANKPGRFAPPLELFDGELEPMLDEVEMLRAWVAIAPPFASRDERLQTAISAATAFLDAPGAMYAPPLIRRHYVETRQAYAAGKHSTRIEEIDDLVVRALLEKRHYHKQRVLGGEHIRASLHSFGQSEPLVVYIPREAALFLPISQRFRVRILAEIHFAQDNQETSPLALRSLALASVVRRSLR